MSTIEELRSEAARRYTNGWQESLEYYRAKGDHDGAAECQAALVPGAAENAARSALMHVSARMRHPVTDMPEMKPSVSE